jgi:hypothetical protein
MNKNLLSFSVILLVAFSVFCCSDDDSEPNNHFTVNLQTFPIESGTIRSIQTQHYPESEEIVYEWDIFLSSGDVDGKKHWVRFILNSSNKDEVPLGTYTYDEEYSDHLMGDYTFYLASIMRNADSDLETATGDLFANTDFRSGTFTIAKSGDAYEISFDLTLDGGATSTGQFKGTLTAREAVTEN